MFRRFSLLHDFGLKASDLDLVEPHASRHVQNLIQLEVQKSGSDPKLIHKRLIKLVQMFDLSYECCLGQLLLVMAESKNYAGFVDCVQQLIVERDISLSPDLATFVLKSISALHQALKGEALLNCSTHVGLCFGSSLHCSTACLYTRSLLFYRIDKH